MNAFSKKELIGLAVVFVILIAISFPNFVISLRRAKDQVRRDDIGSIDGALGEYFNDFGIYPASTTDGRILACKNPNETVTKDKFGHDVVNLIPCEWGKSSFTDLTPGSNKVYMGTLPADPEYLNGPEYAYFSDGTRYQLFASFNGTDEVGYDPKIVARNLKCGSKVCNFGRFFGCPVEKSLSQCEYEDAQQKANNPITQ